MANRLDTAGKNTISDKDLIGIVTELVGAEREIEEATTVLAAARGVKAGILKRAKGMGANKDALVEVRKLAKMDEDERIAYDRDRASYAKLTGVKLYVAPTADKPQGSIILDEKTQKAAVGLDEAKAYDAGFFAGKDAQDISANPHHQTTASNLFERWVVGWHDGQAANAPKQADGVTVASKARRPRKGADDGGALKH